MSTEMLDTNAAAEKRGDFWDACFTSAPCVEGHERAMAWLLAAAMSPDLSWQDQSERTCIAAVARFCTALYCVIDTYCLEGRRAWQGLSAVW